MQTTPDISPATFPNRSIGQMEDGFLPNDLPDTMLICPTLNRWGDGRDPGVLTNMLRSVQRRFAAEGLSDRAAVVLADSSIHHDHGINDVRALNLAYAAEGITPAPTYVLTQQSQQRVTDEVVRRTGVPRDIVEAILLHTGYASNRAKLDMVVAATVLSRRSGVRSAINVLGLDDDTMVPDEYRLMRTDRMPAGKAFLPNSQILVHDDKIDPDMFEMHNNAIGPFFEHLGKTVAEVRKRVRDMKCVRLQHDTMNIALREAREGAMSQFQVSHGEQKNIRGASSARVVAVCPTKHGIPDYRTVEIADSHLRHQFPDKELPVQSILSGPSQPFAFQVSHTNVDSAALARHFDEETSQWPWWYVSSLSISQRNPLQTVNAHYRADNELLPKLMDIVAETTGRLHVYLSGIGAQVSHHRARTGYRPGIHEQAAASLIGNIAATESAKRMHIDGHRTTVEGVDDDYEVPEGVAHKAFVQLKGLADICWNQLNEILLQNGQGDADAIARRRWLETQYLQIFNALREKLGGFDFREFKKHLDTEIRDQIRFFGEVMDAYPQVLAVVHDMIRKGRYPAQRFVPASERTVISVGAPPPLRSDVVPRRSKR